MLSNTQGPLCSKKLPSIDDANKVHQSATFPDTDCDHLLPGKIIGKKWKLSYSDLSVDLDSTLYLDFKTVQLGQGSFGKIYEAIDIHNNDKVAIKFESTLAKKKVLRLEISILKRLRESPYVSSCYDFGAYAATENIELPYFVMSLHGTNLSELRKQRPNNRFSLSTIALLGYQMVDSLRWLHQLGYLHRDVKPSNFVVGLNPLPDHHGAQRPRLYLIDFGLSRRHLEADGSARQSRLSTGFRGTTRYASVHAHQGMDLGRRDDLWSLVYVFHEFLHGHLPWRKEREKDRILALKQGYARDPLFFALPEPFRQFHEHLCTLDYASTPNYIHLLALMERAFVLSEAKPQVPYDWDGPKAKSASFMHKCKQTACDLQQKFLKSNLPNTTLPCKNACAKRLLPLKKDEAQLCRQLFFLSFNRSKP